MPQHIIDAHLQSAFNSHQDRQQLRSQWTLLERKFRQRLAAFPDPKSPCVFRVSCIYDVAETIRVSRL